MSKRILLADDSVTIQKVVELTFMDEGFEVTAVGNGDDALTRVADLNPDLVVADVHMPGASGYEVCRRVKEARPGTPVMLLVGTFQPFDADEAADCGADDHLKKPFDSQELFRRVESLIAAEPEETYEQDDAGEIGVETVAPELESLVLGMKEADEVEVEEQTNLNALAPDQETGLSTDETAEQVPVELSDEDIDRIARRVVELLSDDMVREVSWEVIPDLAEVVIKDRLRELESQID